MSRELFSRISLFVTVFAFVVIVVGAFVRLSDAGLGCPDWPGCYGHIDIPKTADEITQAEQAYPHRPVESAKAWKEMLHRYIAGTLGLLILMLAFMARKVAFDNKVVPNLTIGLVGIVIFQALLGMWTVTLMVKPLIVTMHLMFGMTTLALLWLTTLNAGLLAAKWHLPAASAQWAWFAFAVIVGQIFLGGWTSTNYAALACTEFPGCYLNDSWPSMDFAEGFVLWRGLGINYEYGVLSAEARAAVHMTHRLGALLVFLVTGFYAFRLLRLKTHAAQMMAYVITGLLLLQLTLGVMNVVAGLPLFNAVAHNGGAALLLLSVITGLYLTSKSYKNIHNI